MNLRDNNLGTELEDDGRRFFLCIEPLTRYFGDIPHEIFSVFPNGENGDRDNEYIAFGSIRGKPYMIEFKLWNGDVYIRIMYPYQDPEEYLPI